MSDPLRWCLADDVCVTFRDWDSESAIYFHGLGETMVLDKLGGIAIEGIASGCHEMSALEDWCRQKAVDDSGENLRLRLDLLIERLYELDVLYSAPS